MFAEIALNLPLLNTFHYSVPDTMHAQIRAGQMVQVPFRTKAEAGIVVSVSKTRPAELPESVQPKSIDAILHHEPVVNPPQLALAQWMADRYLASVAAGLWLCIPPGFTGGRDIRVTLVNPRAAARDMFEQHVLSLLLRRGSLMGAQISNALAGEKKADWRRTVERLQDEGVVTVEPILRPPRIRPRSIQTAKLAIHPDEIGEVAPALGKKNRRADLLERLAALGDGEHDLKTTAKLLGTTRPTLKKMADDGLLTLTDDTLALGFSLEDLDDKLIELRDAHTQIHVLKVLARESEAIDVSWVYAQTRAKLEDLKRLEEAGVILLGEQDDWRDQMVSRHYPAADVPTLTDDQRAALDTMSTSLNGQESAAFLLHGVTGSGKTEVYLHVIEQALAMGRTAIFLVPEIALTPQTAGRVASRFPGSVTVLHSGLSDGERYDAWRRAREGMVQVVVGARSALFAPLDNIGVIVLDESHDASYKQSPNVEMPSFRSSPHYDARLAAEELARQHNAVLILGTATPDIESGYRVQRGTLHYLKLEQRILAHREQAQEQAKRLGQPLQIPPDEPHQQGLPPVEIVDMRTELKDGNRSIFSRPLQNHLRETLMRGEQAILFLNRRGKSTYVFCRDCGHVMVCPNCDTTLIYHHDGAMRCHRCGHAEAHPRQCPTCASTRIKYFGAGTQEIETTLRQQFPGARVVRWDADTAANPITHERFLQQFTDRKADIMVGTQMITKGLDLPLVTLVGIISADTALNLPDFRAGERTFQLLTQVAGRAGRSVLGGRVILQTYQPEQPAIQTAAAHDYRTFYEYEIAQRRRLGYPPFRRLVRILFRYPNENDARLAAQQTADRLTKRITELNLTGTEIIGPAPAFFTRIANHYRWHLLLRGPDPAVALRGMVFDKNWYIDVDPVDIL